ncbi:MAG: coproporphyrinogen III oxidase [bacterium]
MHPAHPRAPSMHMHLSYTEMRAPRPTTDGTHGTHGVRPIHGTNATDGTDGAHVTEATGAHDTAHGTHATPAADAPPGLGYWRMMADLNPAIEDPEATQRFRAALRAAAPDNADEGFAQGDRYFYIPALDRHRGVAHFYLEAFDTGDFDADLTLARRIGEAIIATYGAIVDAALAAALAAATAPTAADRARQRAYHTLYFFQVLTLDRGTTSGLLIHDQNDVGILGSLPSHIDRALLASWRDRLPPPQDRLLDRLLAALPDADPTPIDDPTKAALAAAVRAHYRAHPHALDLQASGGIIPPTVQNHR